MRTLTFVLALALPLAAIAEVPEWTNHQGRAMDALGSPLAGNHSVTFSLYDAISGGTPIWTETHAAVPFDNGYYSVAVGSVNPLDADDFDGSDLWMAISIDSGPELTPRLGIGTVPYAFTAQNLSGGTVDAGEIMVNGTTVIDSSGNIDFANIVNAPAASDTLADLGCSNGEIVQFTSGAWTCTAVASLAINASQVTGTIAYNQLPVGTTANTVMPGDQTFSAADVGALPVGTTAADLGAYEITGDGSTQANAAQNCQAILSAHPGSEDGIYWLDPDNDGNVHDAFQTYCDMTRNGGGWTLVMQNNRNVRSDALDPSWSSTIYSTYVRGGALSDDLGSFDILVGLDFWANIGSSGRYETGNTPGTAERQATYSSLSVDPSDNYRLAMSGQTITTGPNQPGIFGSHNGQPWSTIDQDNAGSSCPDNYGHPWWYTGCWSGSLWGSDRSHSPGAYWNGSGGDNWNWGALWIR